MPFRFDRVSRLAKAEATPAGGARLFAYATRPGVFPYRRPDGSIRYELRHPDDVFDPKSLATLRDVTVTVGHVAGGTRTVHATTWRKETVGYVPDVGVRHHDPQLRADFVKVPVVIQDAATLDRVDSGELCENSMGYHCDTDLDPPGVWNGQRYDVRQRNIAYKDLAILGKNEGRAGPHCGLRTDGLGADDAVQENENAGEVNVDKIWIDGVEYVKGSPEHLAKVDQLHKAELAKLRGESDAAKLRADSADKEKAELEALRKEKAERERGDALTKAKLALGAAYDEKAFPVEMTAAQIRRAVVSQAQGGKDLTAESDDYVRAFFDLLEAKAAPPTPAKPAAAPAPAPTSSPAAPVLDARGALRADAKREAPTLHTDGTDDPDPFVAALARNDANYYGKDFPLSREGVDRGEE